MAEKNVSEKPDDFDPIVDGAIVSLQSMYSNWADLPESYLLSGEGRKQVAKMVYNRF